MPSVKEKKRKIEIEKKIDVEKKIVIFKKNICEREDWIKKWRKEIVKLSKRSGWEENKKHQCNVRTLK